MRNSWMQLDLIRLDDETPCGISLGADYCCEHERGIRPLAIALGCGHAGDRGLSQFLAKPICPDNPRVSLYEHNKSTKKIAAETRLTISKWPQHATELADPKCQESRLPAAWVKNGICDQPLAAAWDDEELCVRAFGETERQVVRDLHAAALSGDLLLSVSGNGGNPFGRGGLCLTILSRIPQSIHRAFEEREDNHLKLEAAAEATGIADSLRLAQRRYFALAPEWSSKFKTIIRRAPDEENKSIIKPETSYEVMFFLNPQGQEKYNSGWFTVEELIAWTHNQGPVMKSMAA